jgi:dihydroorotase
MVLLIQGGRVMDPASGRDEVLDVLIEGGKIRKIARDIPGRGRNIIDASGKVVSPGFIDLHTHLRQPGREDEETIETGSRAAAKGGFTTICAMPNTEPPIDDPSLVEFVYDEARRCALVQVLPIATISRGRKGKDLSPMGRLRRAGAVGFSDDGDWVSNSGLMRRALEYVKMLNLPLVSHCEDKTLTHGGVMNEGYYSTTLGLKGIPGEAEEVAIFRDLVLVEMTGSRLHVAHLSTSRGVELVREAKREGLKVTSEVTPHHFTLTHKEVRSFNTNTKMRPPLREEEDVLALRQGLKDGTIDIIATDHAPHTVEEKELDYVSAPFGIIGLETALGLVIRELVKKGTLSLMEALAKLTVNPARILGMSIGRIEEGARADLTIFDPEKTWKVEEEEFLSKSTNSPFVGWELPGKVEWTITGGKVVYQSRK